MQAVVDDCTRPVSRRMMTGDLRILYPRDTEDAQAVRAADPRDARAQREGVPGVGGRRGRTAACSAAPPSFYAAVSVAKTTTFPW